MGRVFPCKLYLLRGITGYAVTPCSAFSQASCRSLDDEREAWFLPEEVGRYELPLGFSHRRLGKCVWVCRSLVFLVKKGAKQ